MDQSPDILLIRLKALGDIIFTLPAVHCVREAFPRAHITFLVSKEYAPLLEGFAEVDEVIALDRTRYRGFNPKGIVAETLRVLGAMRRKRFSLAVDFQGYGETALLTWCSGAPQRWGTCYRPARKWAYTRAIVRDSGLHPIEGHLALLRQAGLPGGSFANHFSLPRNASEAARNLFAKLGLHPAQPTVFIQPFTSNPEKNWPLDRYLASARHWRDRGLQVLFGGGPADSPALEPVRQTGFAVTAGAPLLLSAGLASLSTVVVGGDTGLVHLAEAMGKPVVMIMSSICPGACFPFGSRHLTVLPPPGLPVSAVAPDAVEEACARALAQVSKTAPAFAVLP